MFNRDRLVRSIETSPEQTAVNLGQEAVSLAQEDVRPIEVVRAIVARVDENTDAATAAAREAKRAAAEVNFALNVVIDLANSANQILYFVRFADISRATESVAQRIAELKSIVDKVKFVNVFAVKAVEFVTSAAAKNIRIAAKSVGIESVIADKAIQSALEARGPFPQEMSP